MMRSTSCAESVSIAAEAGFGCSVRSFSSTASGYHRSARDGPERIHGNSFGKRPYTFKIDKIRFDVDFGNCAVHRFASPSQFLTMMEPLGFGIGKCCHAAICPAIGMDHEDHASGVVQPHGFADLLQDEFAFGLLVRRCKALGAACDLDRIGKNHADTFEEFAESNVEAVIETPDDRGVAVVPVARRVEVEYLFQSGVSTPIIAWAIH